MTPPARARAPASGTAVPFTTGDMVAGRYRIVGLLGRGGMGRCIAPTISPSATPWRSSSCRDRSNRRAIFSTGWDLERLRLTASDINLDSVVERVIMRCVDFDPSRRPASSLAVAAALPGGDPLAAALAAGETPSPQLVAAAGDATTIARPIVVALMAAAVVGCVISAVSA